VLASPLQNASIVFNERTVMSQSPEVAVFAGGCFWGMQDLMRKLPGVVHTRVGYCGGEMRHATYDHVKMGRTGHAEALEIHYDPSRISYRDLLAAFFQIHDPTTLNRQGNDRGTQYRSAIFTRTADEMQIAHDTIAEVNASGRWPGEVVTEVVPAGEFWEAEPEHQDYLERYPNGYTCHFVRSQWTLPDRHGA
jgi:peptide-methionine (S)-S-oxide reductase